MVCQHCPLKIYTHYTYWGGCPLWENSCNPILFPNKSIICGNSCCLLTHIATCTCRLCMSQHTIQVYTTDYFCTLFDLFTPLNYYVMVLWCVACVCMQCWVSKQLWLNIVLWYCTLGTGFNAVWWVDIIEFVMQCCNTRKTVMVVLSQTQQNSSPMNPLFLELDDLSNHLVQVYWGC